MSDPLAVPEPPGGAPGEMRRALLALALGLGLGLIARLFESKEARAWREPSEI